MKHLNIILNEFNLFSCCSLPFLANSNITEPKCWKRKISSTFMYKIAAKAKQLKKRLFLNSYLRHYLFSKKQIKNIITNKTKKCKLSFKVVLLLLNVETECLLWKVARLVVQFAIVFINVGMRDSWCFLCFCVFIVFRGKWKTKLETLSTFKYL